MPRSKRSKLAKRNALNKAREGRWLKRRLNLHAPVELDFGDSNIPPLIIEQPVPSPAPVACLDDNDHSSTTSACNPCNVILKANEIVHLDKDKDKDKHPSSAGPNCLICHDQYVQHVQEEQGQDSTPPPASFVSKLPSSLAPSFTKALGDLILITSLNQLVKEALLAELETSLYCSSCIKEIREIAVLFEQFEKLKNSLEVKRVQMITQIQSHSSTGGTQDKVSALRAKLMSNLQQPPPGRLNNSSIESLASRIVNGKVLRQQQLKLSKAQPQVPKSHTRPSKTSIRGRPPKQLSADGVPDSKKTPKIQVVVESQQMKEEDEVWKQELAEASEVKIENEEKEEMEIEVKNEDQDNDEMPKQESMLMDNDDDRFDDNDGNFGYKPQDDPHNASSSSNSDSEVPINTNQLVVKITRLDHSRPSPPPPRTLPQQQHQPPPPPQVISVKVVKCPECMDLFMNQAELDQHQKEEESCRPPLSCKCNLCGKVCNYKSILNHLKAVHYKKNQDNSDDGDDEHSNDVNAKKELSQCPECRKHVKDLPHHTLFKHQVQLSSDACSQQGDSSIFKDYKVYRLHLSTKHAAEHGSHKCQDCGRTFIRKQDLMVHKTKIHNPDFPHTCNQCQQRFSEESELQNHIKGFHDLLCHICDAKFTARVYLNGHLRRHSGRVQRKYKCDQCTRSFTDSANLKDHLDAVHGDNREAYVCDVCGKGFPIYNYLYIHLRSHETPEEKEARRLKAKAAAEARKLSGKPVLIPKGRPRTRPMNESKGKKRKKNIEAENPDQLEEAFVVGGHSSSFPTSSPSPS